MSNKVSRWLLKNDHLCFILKIIPTFLGNCK